MKLFIILQTKLGKEKGKKMLEHTIKSNPRYLLLVSLLALFVCSCKPKTELYLERGLDILSNKHELNYKINEDVVVKELGIIRDQKEGIKTLVLKLNDSAIVNAIDKDIIIGITVWIIDENKKKRIEKWDFIPKFTQVNKHKYIMNEIKIEEDQVNKMKIFLYKKNEGRKNKIGPTIILNKVNTYND
ncbi:hypothetical protein FVF61_12840 [Formosa maritima]|uniref:Lipoprotein n=1 Tax=Formosa maritima TaxID=2592046 RepID=A0A5D0G2Z0_9FLAO|nr:hypothetical protein FVF61_12840 [Formosa maritima]